MGEPARLKARSRIVSLSDRQFFCSVRNSLQRFTKSACRVIILHRPYSLPDVVAMGMVSAGIAGANFLGVITGAVIAISIWLFATGLLEFVHKHSYRSKISQGYLAFTLATMFVASRGKPATLIWTVVAVVFTFIYTAKLKSRLLAILSPVNRAVVQVAIMMAAATAGGMANAVLRLVPFIFFYHIARNYTAEIRDLPWDGWNVAASVHERWMNNRLFASLLFLLSAISGVAACNGSSVFLLALAPGLIVLPDRTGYRAHQFAVMTSTMIYLVLMFEIYGVAVINIAILLMLMSIFAVGATYDMVPRPANPSFPHFKHEERMKRKG